MSENKKQRAGGFLLKDGKILIIRQVFNGEEFFTIPGGTVEPGETFEETLYREFLEETSLKIEIEKFLFEIIDDRQAKYYLVKYIDGELKLGGPEKERMNENDQYYLEWYTPEEASKLPFYPRIMGSKIKEFLLL